MIVCHKSPLPNAAQKYKNVDPTAIFFLAPLFPEVDSERILIYILPVHRPLMLKLPAASCGESSTSRGSLTILDSLAYPAAPRTGFPLRYNKLRGMRSLFRFNGLADASTGKASFDGESDGRGKEETSKNGSHNLVSYVCLDQRNQVTGEGMEGR